MLGDLGGLTPASLASGSLDEITRLNTAFAGRYRVERELGAGGMATVYLTRDLRHNRFVALKVVRPEFRAAVEAARFLAEIEITANLQHPYILPLFDSGEAESFLFYTMPYIDGETLRQRIDREGRLPIDEAVRIGISVAEALHVAHEQGVVHRDVKPSNILLSRGQALVADFGIALTGLAAEHTRLTRTGNSVGSVGYLSPEQASGEREVDHRADIFSLGCVVYEMLAGQPPFAGSNFMAILAKQLTSSAPSVRTHRSEVPEYLAVAVSRALAKEPADRFESVAAFAAAIVTRDSASPPPIARRKAVVVIPFVNRSADADHEYFSDGLTDEVIADLSRISALRVISRNSSAALKGTSKDSRTLAQELDVTHLVTGTVRRAGIALRVTAELVEAMTGESLWSEKFAGTADDVFGIQEEISRQIVEALKVRFSDAEQDEIAERPIDNPVAYDCYLRACQLMYNWTPEGQHRALTLVDEALAIVGATPLLLATKGQLHWNMVNMNMAPRGTTLAQASACVDQALALDPGSSLGIFVRGLIAGMRGESETALVDLYRAHALRPGDTNVLVELVRFSEAAGLRHSLKYVELLAKTDPLSPPTPLLSAIHHWLHASPVEAAAAARRAMEVAPEPSMLHITACWILAASGCVDDAIGLFARASATTPNVALATQLRFFQHVLEGDAIRALALLTPELESAVQNEYHCRIMADAMTLLGRTDDALRWLRMAMQYGFINFPNVSANDAFLQPLRAEPAFVTLVAELRPRWQAIVRWEAEMLTGQGSGQART